MSYKTTETETVTKSQCQCHSSPVCRVSTLARILDVLVLLCSNWMTPVVDNVYLPSAFRKSFHSLAIAIALCYAAGAGAGAIHGSLTRGTKVSSPPRMVLVLLLLLLVLLVLGHLMHGAKDCRWCRECYYE